jgi:phage gpG-like protein
MSDTRDFDLKVERVANAIRGIPRRAATLAVNFSKDRFRAQNWVDHTTQPWKPRSTKTWRKKAERPGRAILVKSGRLRRSIRVISVSAERIIIGTDVPYAEAHNDGFRGKVKQLVKKHTRRRYGRVSSTNIETRKTSSRRGMIGEITVKEHERTIDQNIPRRRFIGSSAVLNSQLERMITVEIVRAFKNSY